MVSARVRVTTAPPAPLGGVSVVRIQPIHNMSVQTLCAKDSRKSSFSISWRVYFRLPSSISPFILRVHLEAQKSHSK